LKNFAHDRPAAKDLRPFQRLAHRQQRGWLPLVADGEFFSPVSPAACEDSPAVLGLHSFAKSVLVLSLSVAWLKRPFHLLVSSW
jgi:hypothetical protein